MSKVSELVSKQILKRDNILGWEQGNVLLYNHWKLYSCLATTIENKQIDTLKRENSEWLM